LIIRGERSYITVEYANMLAGLAGFAGGSLFNFDSLQGTASIFISGAALLILGYLIKEIWGAIIAFSAGTFLFLYLKGLLPI